jgi:TonB family protein
MTTQPRIFFYLFAASLLLAGSSSLVCGQAKGIEDWQKLRPEDEEFNVLMAKDAKFEEGPEPYHRMTVNTRLYLSAPERGPVLAVASISGIKSNPAQYTEIQRTNSYVDAFKTWFFPKVRKTPVTMTLVGEKALNGNPGREYRVVLGDLSGTARVYTTRRRFYAVVFLNSKKDDVLTDQFLSSFYLPEKSGQPAANDAASAATPQSPDLKPAAAGKGAEGNTAGEAAAASDAGAAAGDKTKPIAGGALNSKALYLPTPDYPSGTDASGMVAVQVVVDEQGTVISAKAVSGPQSLQQASVSAALLARFAPTSLSGQPVKVSGVITFKFGKP